ncbi:MAG: hypothetical protein HZA31_05625 [Opitutae bacterium]|nr:hypothetical protein [Opitutae bacterium]
MQGVDLLGGATVPAWSNFSGSAPGANWTASDPGISNSTGYTRFHADGTLTSSQSNISGPYTMSFTINAVSSGTGVMSLSAGGSSSLDFKTITGAVDGTDHAFVINVDASGNATWSMDSGAQTGSLATFSPGGGGAITFTQTNSAQNDLHIKDGFTLTSSGGGGGTGNIADVVAASSLSSLSLSSITGAIQDLATNRAQNGASQSRLGFATELLTVNKANLEAANSRIADVDVADESTQLARFNILVQAGTAMLSQANQSSQSVMKLLG